MELGLVRLEFFITESSIGRRRKKLCGDYSRSRIARVGWGRHIEPILTESQGAMWSRAVLNVSDRGGRYGKADR